MSYYFKNNSLCVYCGEDLSFKKWGESHKYGMCQANESVSNLKRKEVNDGPPHIHCRGKISTLSVTSG